MTAGSRHQKRLNRFFQKLTIKKINAHLMKHRKGDGDLEFRNNGYLHSFDYLRQRVQIEQRRAERTDYQFALVVIDLSQEPHRFQPAGDAAALKEKRAILFTILKTILRITDVVVKYGDSKIVILLPDTNQAGSESVVLRITKILTEIPVRSPGAAFQDLSICRYGYPEQVDEINDLLNKSLNDNEESAFPQQRNNWQMRSADWPTERSPGNAKKLELLAESKNWLAVENSFSLVNKKLFGGSWNWQKSVKRYLDILISATAIIILLPLMLLIAILIKITSPGPVFFKQERIGYRGKRFIIYKFRTMYQSRDDQIHKDYVRNFIQNSLQHGSVPGNGDPIFKIKNDPRVTPIGKVLRRTSLDEIGQFFNVIKGDMSLIGPRPPIPYEVEIYDHWHKRRFWVVKPGITGLWQIYGRNTITFNEMIRLDLAYADNWSLALDLKIFLKTIWAVVSMKGAY